MTTIDVAQLYCPESGGKPGEDSTTHHLQPRSAGQGKQQMVCRDCKRTEKQLRDACAGAEKWVPEAIAEQQAHIDSHRCVKEGEHQVTQRHPARECPVNAVECEAFNVQRQGMCLTPLGDRGECPRQGEHGDEFDRNHS